MQKSKIEWCDSTWNPVTGCLHGCGYCYAKRIAERFGGHSCRNTGYKASPFEYDGKVQFRYELSVPARRRDKSGKLTIAPFPCCFEPTLHHYRLDEPCQRQ